MSSVVPLQILATIPRPHEEAVARSTADFPPGLLVDIFLSYTPDETAGSYECRQKQIEELKEEVRKEIKVAATAKIRSPELAKLIDSIQLLGLAYHFETEIGEALKQMYQDSATPADEDLATSSLQFRLLRQGGYPVSVDVFNKFKDEEAGKFKESLVGDTHGMLALYEASHLMVHGEDILEEALAFTTTNLQSFVTDHPSDNPLSKQVIHALNRPIRKSLTRVEARHYISTYQQEGSCDKSLLKLAKLDFNLLQSRHREGLTELCRWWKDLDFATKLPFARNRLVESYFWGLVVIFEPQYSLALKFLTKITTLLTVSDDIYDAYGTFQELQLLTEATERWDASCIDQLPADYLQWYYRALLDVYEEMEEEMAKRGKLYRAHCVKQLIKRVFQTHFVEAEWLKERYAPTFDEYFSNALETTCYTVLTATSLLGMGDEVTEEVFKWLLSRGKMLRASECISRLMDDLVTHEFEKTRDHIPTGIECYMKQHDVTEKEACDELNKLLENAWKDINQGFLEPRKVPLSVAGNVLNFAQVMDVLYKDGDAYTHVGKLMKDLIASTLIDPVPM